MVKKILLIRFSSIGDIVLTTPVIRHIARHFPEAEIHFLTKTRFVAILASHPALTRIHSYDGNFPAQWRVLKSLKFDLIIDLHKNLRSTLFRATLGVSSISYSKLTFRKWLTVLTKKNHLPNLHLVDRYLAALEKLGITDDGGGLDYFLAPGDAVDPARLPERFQSGYVAFAIGAQHFTKRLPAEKITAICDRIPAPILLLGGPEDREAGDQVAGTTKGLVFNGCGLFRLNESAWLIQQALGVISHDTGLMHIAAAFRKNIVSIWGNTIPAFGMYPFRPGPKSALMEVPDLSCRPCSRLGHPACPKAHFHCMARQDPRAISEVVASWLAQRSI